jgi:polyphosphate kinase
MRPDGPAAAARAEPSAPDAPLRHAPYDLPVAVRPVPVPADPPLDHPGLYLNRELGDLDFDARVLAQAMDARIPLLERIRYLSIAASNLDEFVMKRVGGLLRQQAAGVVATSPDGRTPDEQLALVRAAMRPLHARMEALWRDELRPALRRDVSIGVVDEDDLDAEETAAAERLFERDLYGIVTPLAVDSGRPFPLISNLSLSLAVILRRPGAADDLFARIKVPTSLGRFVRTSRDRLLPIEQLLERHVDRFFPGMELVGVWRFRVTRNADVRLDEEEAEDLLAAIGEELRERRFAPVVRLEVERAMPAYVRRYLASHLRVAEDDVVEADRVLALRDLAELADVARPEHLFEPWQGITARRIAAHYAADDEATMFDLIRASDVLVHHPYDLFRTSVQRFIEEAADDPDVLAIKQTLYRTSSESRIVAALVRAAERGKQVAVLVEVKARFDEANNIEWGERLEAAGVHVSYGFVDLKIHTKVALVVRREHDGIRTYAHVGTGNYNVRTARMYTDLGLLTCDPRTGSDLVNLFHHITGYAPEQRYGELLIAPWDMRDRFLGLIEREIGHQRAGRGGRIVAKMNGLDDVPIIQALYRASQAGVEIDLIVRGHCRLRPGVDGVSDTIRVTSIIGRFLEHDRLFLFGNGGEREVYLGSADWKRRNLSDRIEAVTPVRDPELVGRLVGMLESALDDNSSAWDLRPDGRYVQRAPGPGERARGLQQELIERALRAEV